MGKVEEGDIIGLKCSFCSQSFSSSYLCDWKISILSLAKEELSFIKGVLNSQLAWHLSKFHSTFFVNHNDSPLKCILCNKSCSKNRRFRKHLLDIHSPEVNEIQNAILEYFINFAPSISIGIYLNEEGAIKLKKINQRNQDKISVPKHLKENKSVAIEEMKRKIPFESQKPPSNKSKELKLELKKEKSKKRTTKVDSLAFDHSKDESIGIPSLNNSLTVSIKDEVIDVFVKSPLAKKAKLDTFLKDQSNANSTLDEIISSPEDTEDYESEGVECSYCHLILIDEVALAFHYTRSHVTIEKDSGSPLQCKYCNEFFSSPFLFRVHLTTAHLTNRVLQNCLCRKSFLSSLAFKIHSKNCWTNNSLKNNSTPVKQPEVQLKAAELYENKIPELPNHPKCDDKVTENPSTLMPFISFIADDRMKYSEFNPSSCPSKVPLTSAQLNDSVEEISPDQQSNEPEELNETINKENLITVSVSEIVRSDNQNKPKGLTQSPFKRSNSIQPGELKNQVKIEEINIASDDDDFITLEVAESERLSLPIPFIPSAVAENEIPKSQFPFSLEILEKEFGIKRKDTRKQNLTVLTNNLEKSNEQNKIAVIVNSYENTTVVIDGQGISAIQSFHEGGEKPTEVEEEGEKEKEEFDTNDFVCSENWCEKRFKTLQEHSDHAKFHLSFMHVAPGIVACRDCAFTFKPVKGESSLETHAATHFIHQHFVCKICLRNFTKKFTLSAHYKQKYNLSIHDNFHQIAQLANPSDERLRKIYTKRRYECIECKTLFLKKNDHIFHQKLHNCYQFIPSPNPKIMKYQCNECGVFVLAANRRPHAISHGTWGNEHLENSAQETLEIEELVDSSLPEFPQDAPEVDEQPSKRKRQSRANKAMIKEEILRQKREEEQRRCKEDMEEAIKFALGPRTKVPPLKKFHCAACNSVYQNGEDFKTHLKVHDNFRVFLTADCDNAFECVKCLICVNGSELDTHDCENANLQIPPSYHTEGSENENELNYSLNIGAGVLEQPEPQNFQFDCKFCFLPLPTFDILKTHLSSFHRANENPICKFCYEVFADDEEEFLHCANFHFEEDEEGGILDCKVCFEQLQVPSHFREHVKGAHCEEENTCGICNKNFVEETEFYNHMQKFHPRVKIEKLDDDEENM